MAVLDFTLYKQYFYYTVNEQVVIEISLMKYFEV